MKATTTTCWVCGRGTLEGSGLRRLLLVRACTYQGTRTATEKGAVSIVGNYIGANPNLQAEEITDKGTHCEDEIGTKQGSLVLKLAITRILDWFTL